MKSKTSKPNPDHIIFDAARGVLFCQHCGGAITWTLPIELSLFVALLNGFMRAHESCLANDSSNVSLPVKIEPESTQM